MTFHTASRARIVVALLVLLLPGLHADGTPRLIDHGISPSPRPAGGCDCISLQPLSAAVRKEAPYIFEGKVVEMVERSLHTLRTTSGGGSSETRPMGREVVFEVARAWNGVTTKRLTVAAPESDCMFPFEIDHTYLVFAWKDEKGEPATGICTRTTESGHGAAVLGFLGPPITPGAGRR